VAMKCSCSVISAVDIRSGPSTDPTLDERRDEERFGSARDEQEGVADLSFQRNT